LKLFARSDQQNGGQAMVGKPTKNNGGQAQTKFDELAKMMA